MQLAVGLALSVLTAARVATAHPGQALPPPPVMETYDPQPGPFIIPVDGDGRVDPKDYAIVANAVTMWSGDYLQAFLICFQTSGADVAPSVVTRALDTVAAELRKRGGLVVEPAGLRCDEASPRSARFAGSYVTIMGVVRG